MTLVELLVALAIGGLLIVGAVTVYMQSRNTYRVSDASARLQEIGRYAMDVMEPDVRQAGYWGMTNRVDFIENRRPLSNWASIETNECGPEWITDLERYVDGRESEEGGGVGYNLGCAVQNSEVPWADVLIVRRASTNTAGLENDRVQIQSDRIRGVITNDGIRVDGLPEAQADVRNLLVHAYYINEMAPGVNGLRRFELRRKTLIEGPQVVDQDIIQGVEDLQVQFGIDTDGDGSVEQYVEAGSAELAAAVGQVMAIRLWLRIVSDEREVGFVNNKEFTYAGRTLDAFGDERRRIVVSKTIQLRNQQPSST